MELLHRTRRNSIGPNANKRPERVELRALTLLTETAPGVCLDYFISLWRAQEGMPIMRLRSSKLVLALVACTATGTMAVTTTTAFASSSHHGGSTKTTVKGNGNCTVVNSSHVTCNVSKHGHGNGHGNGHGGRNDPGLGHGLEDVVAGVGDILGGLLGGL
jgi:hypothetical protein